MSEQEKKPIIEGTNIYQYLNARSDFQNKRYGTKLELLEKYLSEEYYKTDYYFSDYTKHDWTHTLSVLQYMFVLIPSPDEIKTETFMLIIFCALLHDIGMAFDEKNVHQLLNIDSSLNKEMLKDNNKVQTYLRLNHGKLARFKISEFRNMKEYADVLSLSIGGVDNDYDFSDLVATICESHNCTIRWLGEELKNNKDCIFVACLLRLADLLDIDGKRAYHYYQLSRNPEGESQHHFAFNQIMGSKEKIQDCSGKSCDPTCPRRDKGCGKKAQKVLLHITMPSTLDPSDEAYLRRMISDYVDEIEQEIQSVTNLLEDLEKPFHISLKSSVDLVNTVPTPNHQPQISTCKIRIDYSAIREFLYGNHLYPESIYGIREIVQNCYDACKSFKGLAAETVGWTPTILLRYDKSANTISIIDSGIGMTDFVIKEYFLNIGRSIYTSNDETVNSRHLLDHIGYFGLGFYAVFMLVNHAIIITKSSKEDNITRTIEIDKSINYATLTTTNDSIREHGTEVILDVKQIAKALKRQNEEDCCELICDYIKYTFLSDGIAIKYEAIEDKKPISVEEIELEKIEKISWNSDISHFLADIDSKANLKTRSLTPIFFFESVNGTPILTRIDYDNLLVTLQRKMKHSQQIHFMNLGDFYIFTSEKEVLAKWEDIYNTKDGRINYTSWENNIGGGIDLELNEFCKSNEFIPPTHCDILMLHLLIEGRNVALCKDTVVCSKHSDKMMKFDACGDIQFTDKIFLRNVHLPKVHITLPWLNFRYQFSELIANIKTNGVFPILARDDLSSDEKQDLNYAFGYAICAMQRSEIENIENQLIIKKYYSKIDNNIFINRGAK